ncbi:MAG: flavodoxin-dependent (E)-4-hydroxy-3-methylbut-2-enyl-diphosphate synthase [candidate division WOR-3 bacterium]
MKNRKKTKSVKIGSIEIGGGKPIAIQSMTKTDTHNVEDTVSEIKRLEEEGCELVRVAVPDKEAAGKLGEIKKRIGIPLIADIHYDYLLAIEAVKQGVDKIRINPGNIGTKWKVKEIVKSCKERGIPIRVGANAGSVKKEYIKKFNGITPEALFESVMDEVRILEDLNFDSIVVSIKSSDIKTTVLANQIFSEKRDYPVHIGVTEAGPSGGRGEVYSAIGIGFLLKEGIGDTIRVSLTGDPLREVRIAQYILSALGLRNFGPRIISCPTCGRLQFDIENVVKEVEEKVKRIHLPITIAIMGCSVNGPGEAKEADIGIAGGKNAAVIFKKGKKLAVVKGEKIVEVFLSELNKLIKEEEKWQ